MKGELSQTLEIKERFHAKYLNKLKKSIVTYVRKSLYNQLFNSGVIQKHLYRFKNLSVQAIKIGANIFFNQNTGIPLTATSLLHPLCHFCCMK